MDALFGSSPSTSYSTPYGSQINQILPGLTSLASGETSSIPSLFAAALDNLNTAGTGYTNLAAGQLPAGYANNFQQGINNDVQNALGTGVANLAASGTMGGNSQTGLTNQIANSAANTAANDYQQGLETAAGLNSGLAGIGTSEAGVAGDQQSQIASLLAQLLGQNSTQVNPGSAGLIPSLLGGIASSGGMNSLFSGLFSPATSAAGSGANRGP